MEGGREGGREGRREGGKEHTAGGCSDQEEHFLENLMDTQTQYALGGVILIPYLLLFLHRISFTHTSRFTNYLGGTKTCHSYLAEKIHPFCSLSTVTRDH